MELDNERIHKTEKRMIVLKQRVCLTLFGLLQQNNRHGEESLLPNKFIGRVAIKL